MQAAKENACSWSTNTVFTAMSLIGVEFVFNLLCGLWARLKEDEGQQRPQEANECLYAVAELQQRSH